jgi:hypothetical protein
MLSIQKDAGWRPFTFKKAGVWGVAGVLRTPATPHLPLFRKINFF